MIRKFLAGFVLSVFVVSAALFYLVVTLYFTILNKNFYNSDEFASYSYDLILSELPNYFKVNLPESISPEYALSVVKKHVTVVDIKPIITDFGNEFSEAINAGGPHEFRIDLTSLIDKRGLIAEEFANHLVENLNTCTDPSVYLAENPRCILGSVSKNDFVRQFKATFDRKLFSNVSNEFTFSLNFPTINKSSAAGLVQTVFYGYMAFLTILLILIGLIIFRPFTRVLKWIIFGILKYLILFGLAVFIPSILPIKMFSMIFNLIFQQISSYLLISILVFFVLFILTIIFDKKQIA